MQPEINKADMKTWLEGSNKMEIKAYIESYMPTLSLRENLFPSTSLYDALKKISVMYPLPHDVILETMLGMELQAWDILSDEALRDFEQGLE